MEPAREATRRDYPPQPPGQARERFTRRQLSTFVLLILAGAAIVLSLLIASPLVPALTWALSLAVATNPVHTWIRQRLQRPNLAAALAVVIVACGIILPSFVVGQRLLDQAQAGFDVLQQQVKSGELSAKIERTPVV